MLFRLRNLSTSQLLGAAAATLAIALLAGLTNTESPAAEKTKRKGAITKLTFDPTAERIAMFDGIENESLEVTVLPKDEFGGSILIENKTDKPLTVELPEAIVGVHVLKQFGGGVGGIGTGAGLGAGGLGGQGQMGQGGMAQSFGGGMGGMGMGGMGMGGMGMGGMGMGGGFFSVPPEKVVKIPYQSVCLEHGKPSPSPKMTYRLVRLEKYTDDPALQELIKLVGNNRIDRQAAQAAAWHLTDDMSWRELAAKHYSSLGGLGPKPYFTRAQLFGAQNIVSTAVAKVKERENGDEQPAVRVIPSRVRATR